MTILQQNLHQIKEKLPEDVTLVAVSKTKPNSAIQEAYDYGQRVFGENKIQEMVSKWEQLPDDIRWHMIGHVQTNKVKYMAPFVSLIHAVDSHKLLKEINKQAKANDRTISCLIQVKIAKEDSKFGVDPAEIENFLAEAHVKQWPNVRVEGLMGMATFTDNEQQVREEFAVLQRIYTQYKSVYNFSILSMGMSGDYQWALDYGSTMVRIGSSIFGSR